MAICTIIRITYLLLTIIDTIKKELNSYALYDINFIQNNTWNK
jgi:hypothetical protein